MAYKLKISFKGKQAEFEAENCIHGFSADSVQIRGNSMFIGEGQYMREVDLSKPIKNFKVKIVEEAE